MCLSPSFPHSFLPHAIPSFFPSFSHSFNKHLLSTYSTRGPILNTTKTLSWWSLRFSGGDRGHPGEPPNAVPRVSDDGGPGIQRMVGAAGLRPRWPQSLQSGCCRNPFSPSVPALAPVVWTLRVCVCGGEPQVGTEGPLRLCQRGTAFHSRPRSLEGFAGGSVV